MVSIHSEHYALGGHTVLCPHELSNRAPVRIRKALADNSELSSGTTALVWVLCGRFAAGGVMVTPWLAINDKASGFPKYPCKFSLKGRNRKNVLPFLAVLKLARAAGRTGAVKRNGRGKHPRYRFIAKVKFISVSMKRTSTSSAKKNDIPIEDAEVQNRFEIRLKMSVPCLRSPWFTSRSMTIQSIPPLKLSIGIQV